MPTAPTITRSYEFYRNKGHMEHFDKPQQEYDFDFTHRLADWILAKQAKHPWVLWAFVFLYILAFCLILAGTIAVYCVIMKIKFVPM